MKRYTVCKVNVAQLQEQLNNWSEQGWELVKMQFVNAFEVWVVLDRPAGS